MKTLALLLALLLALPALATAQLDGPATLPRLTVTPHVGLRAPYGGRNVVHVRLAEGEFDLEQERSGSAAIGGDAALRLWGPISLVAGGTYTKTGEVRYFEPDTAVDRYPDLVYSISDAMWFGKLGLSARFESPRSLTDLRRRPSTDLFVAAAAVREFDDLHPALNFGFQGALAAAPGVEVVAGVEDYLVFWRHRELTARVGGILQDLYADEEVERVDLHYAFSNILKLRVGARLAVW